MGRKRAVWHCNRGAMWGEEGKVVEGGKLPSFCPSKKSGEKLLGPAPKFEEWGFAPLQEGRGLQVWNAYTSKYTYGDIWLDFFCEHEYELLKMTAIKYYR